MSSFIAASKIGKQVLTFITQDTIFLPDHSQQQAGDTRRRKKHTTTFKTPAGKEDSNWENAVGEQFGANF